MNGPIITLLTDFGREDTYVGQIKGVLLGINPEVRIVDLSHEVARHDVVTGAMMLREAWSFFPEGTIHVGVVDPGVGGGRRAMAAEVGGHRFVGPDNGLLIAAINAVGEGATLISLENAQYFREQVSTTFHGRDLFAPVAAHLSLGLALDQLGPRFDDPTPTPMHAPLREGNVLVGEVLRVDHFGNLVTNIRPEHLPGDPLQPVTAQIRGLPVHGIYRTYEDVEPGELMVLWGSGGFLEISSREKSAARVIGAGVGSSVVLSIPAKNA